MTRASKERGARAGSVGEVDPVGGADTVGEVDPVGGADTVASGDGFAAVWSTLGLDATQIAVDATIRPARAESRTEPSVRDAASAGLSVATLPRISIDIGSAADSAATEGTFDAGDIRITGVLGEGGMGRVLLGRQRSLARDVAVKTVKEHLARTPHAGSILAEGLVTGQLEHPNIIPVHQLGRDVEERPILVMKRIAGVSWQELLASPDHAMWAKIPAGADDRLRSHLEILMQVANALSFAHSRGVIHRDVKPENVMVGEFGEVYLVDWGIAHRFAEARGGGVVGTPSYLAPEMLDATRPLDPTTDVYLLGGVLHTILTGRPRHEGRDVREALEAAFASRPVDYDDGVPGELGELANEATRRDPSARPESAQAFRRAVARYLSHRTSIALSREAEARLDELEGLTPEARRDPALVARLASESRFGFLQARREWDANPDAARGLERTLVALARVELARENAEAVAALLAELDTPHEELAAELLALRRRLADREAEAEAHRKNEHEQDLAVGQRGRRLLVATLMLVGLCITAFLVGRGVVSRERPEASPRELVVLSGIIGLAATVSAIVGRRTVFSNQINRRLLGVLGSSIALIFAHRVAALISGAPTPETLRGDLLILSMALTAGGFFVSRAWLFVGLFLALSSFVSVFVPSVFVEGVFGGATLVALGSVGLFWRSNGSKAPRAG